MSRANGALIVLTLASFGLLGCAQSHSTGPSAADRLKAMEVKNGKLETDFRAVASARDQLRRQLAAAEEQHQQLQMQMEELQAINRKCETLRSQLLLRTSQRDNALIQFEQFRTGLRDLLGQVEAAAPQLSAPVTSAAEIAPPSNS